MLLNPPSISSDLLTWSGCEFSAEASDFNGLEMGRVWDDSCDLGFTVVSSKTGKRVVFVHAETVRDREGDIVATKFISVTPGYDLRGTIFND